MDTPMKCPSPFDYKAYTDYQRAINGDPWKMMKTQAKISEEATRSRTEKAQKGKDLIFAMNQKKEFHVYARAGMPKCKN